MGKGNTEKTRQGSSNPTLSYFRENMEYETVVAVKNCFRELNALTTSAGKKP